MKRSNQWAMVAAAALMATVLPALSQESRVFREGNSWVEEVSGSMPAVRSLRVNTDMGAVRVEGGDLKEVQYVIRKRSYSSSEESARRSFEQFHVTAVRRGETALLEGNWQGGRQRKFSADFLVKVPRGIEFAKLNSDGGNVEVRSIVGRLDAETGGGSIHLDDLGGPVSAETGGGNIEVGSAAGDLGLRSGGGNIRVSSTKGRLTVSTGGGSISVQSAAMVDAETGGGGIEVERCSGNVRAETGGGAIEINDIAGSATLETGGGSIRLSGAKGPVRAETGGGSLELMKLYQGVRAQTGAGSITAEFLGNGGSASMLETSAGDVIVYIAPNVKITVRASIDTAFGHKIRSDFAEFRTWSEGGEWGPKTMYAEGSLNGGGPLLKVRTTIGNIELRRAK